jgi:hypothetical protein
VSRSTRSASRARIAREEASGNRGVLLPLLAAMLGLALVVVAFPRLIAALYAAPVGEVMGKLDGNDPSLAVGELLAAREALQLSLAWDGDGLTAIKLARIDLTLAAREFRAGGNPQPMIDETIDASRLGLTLAPAQARGWLLLAEATLAKTADPGAIVGPLVESMRASPYDIWMAPNRAELGLRAWPWLDAAAREMVAGQIRLTTIRWLDRTVTMARRAGNPTPVREALAGDPEKLRRFDVLYLQTP